MAMAGARSEVATLLRALMTRLNIQDQVLLSAQVDKLVAAIRPGTSTDSEADVRQLASNRARLERHLTPEKRARFESSFLKLAARRDKDMPRMFALLGQLADNHAVKALLSVASAAAAASPAPPTATPPPVPSTTPAAVGATPHRRRAPATVGDGFTTPSSRRTGHNRSGITSATRSTAAASLVNPESARRPTRAPTDTSSDATSYVPSTPASNITQDLQRVLASVRSAQKTGSRTTRSTRITTTLSRRTRGSSNRPGRARRRRTSFTLGDKDLDPSVLRYGSRIMLKSGAMGGAGGYLAAGADGVADASGCGLALSFETFIVVSPSVTARLRGTEDQGPVLLGDHVCLLSPHNNKYLCADAGSGNLVFQSSRGKWEVLAKDYVAGVGAVASSGGSGDGFVHINERVNLRFSSGLCMQLATTSHGTTRVCLGAPTGTYGMSQLGSLDWYLVNAHAPFEPEWNRCRPFLIGAELAVSGLTAADAGTAAPMESLPAALQERLLVEDLLYALLGIEGTYIRLKRPTAAEGLGKGATQGAGAGAGAGSTASAAHQTSTFEGIDACMRDVEFWLPPDQGINTSLAFLVERILPVCQCYSRCSWYAEMRSRYEAGLVANAFAAACRLLLREYTLFVAQLEHFARQGRLSLQKMWFFIQPSLRTLSTLEAIIFAAPFAMGGALLNSIHKSSARSGDAQARNLARFLLERAAAPYVRMLEQWIFLGRLDDPHGEFMVKQDTSLGMDSLRTDPESRYWTDRFAVQPDQVPMFLASLEKDILTTGKYLNVLRDCDTNVRSPVAIAIPFAEDARDYSGIVHKARAFASTTLLEYMLRKTQFLPRLKSLKRYFLLHEGDFLVHFLDLAESHLSKPVQDVTLTHLQSLLDLAVRSSIAHADPFKDDLVCVLQPVSLLQKLETASQQSAGLRPTTAAPPTPRSGWAAFSLDYKVAWPLSIVLSRAALSRYQMLFQHLFFCKHVERRLCNAWLSQQATKQLRLGRVFAPWHALRHRMLHFMQNLTYYMMTEVLEPCWHQLERKLATVKDLDELKVAHDDFLYKCLDQCLLTHTHLELLKILTKLTTQCLLFAEQVSRLMASLEASRASAAAAAATKPVPAEVRARGLAAASQQFAAVVTQGAHVRTISRDNKIFDQHLRQFMTRLRDRASQQFNSHLANLCMRLDYNSFYGSHLAL